MKKLHLTFGIIAAIITIAAIVVAIIMYAGSVGNTDTSFPAWTAFVLVGIYYAIGIAVLGALWLIAWLIFRRRTCKK